MLKVVIMALVTHQVQGSCTTFPKRPVSWNRRIESKHFRVTLPLVERTDRFISLRCKGTPCLRVGAPLLQGPKAKLLKISSFRGIGQNEESCGRAVGSKSSKNSVKLSYVPQESEETLAESPKVQNVTLSSNSAADETSEGSQAIQNLFRNWLTLLSTPSPNQVVDEAFEGPSSREISQKQNGMQKNEMGKILRAVWFSFVDLDAMIKIPLLIFIPLYLALNVVYGAEVSKELTPLWVFGPLIVALYIKMFRAICALYVFSFKQTATVVKNLPTYYLVVYNYIASGNLKAGLQSYIWQPVVDSKNLDYKEVSKGKMKDFNSWLVERYIDFVELIWPYYCRTIRFLKRANLI